MDDNDPQTQMQAIHQQVGGWFDAFVASPQYEALSAIQKEKAQGVIRFFTEYSFRYVGAAPTQWDRNVLAECCVEVLPRKVSAERAFFEAVAPVLSAFFAFLAGTGHLPRARDLSEVAAALGDQIVAASADERNWGPAKAFIMAAEEAGVDTCDQQAMSQFLIEHNLRQLARLEARRGAPIRSPRPRTPSEADPHSLPSPGRNDPCPCGSGRKFKKCCGSAGPAA